jgi:hypothetical protein
MLPCASSSQKASAVVTADDKSAEFCLPSFSSRHPLLRLPSPWLLFAHRRRRSRRTNFRSICSIARQCFFRIVVTTCARNDTSEVSLSSSVSFNTSIVFSYLIIGTSFLESCGAIRTASFARNAKIFARFSVASCRISCRGSELCWLRARQLRPSVRLCVLFLNSTSFVSWRRARASTTLSVITRVSIHLAIFFFRTPWLVGESFQQTSRHGRYSKYKNEAPDLFLLSLQNHATIECRTSLRKFGAW